MKLPQMLSAILCTLLFFSCSSPLDFDQLNQYSPNQVIAVPFILFTVDDTNFDSTAAPVPSIFERSDFKILDGTFLKESLVKLEFDFEIKNQIKRAFDIEIIFRELDPIASDPLIDGRIVHTESLNIEASKNFTKKVETLKLQNSRKQFLERSSTLQVSRAEIWLTVYRSIYIDWYWARALK